MSTFNIRNKVITCLTAICMLLPLLPASNITYAEDSDIIKGNQISITDSNTGVTYKYVNFNGLELVHPYMGHEAWTSDGKMFLCGVNNKVLNPDSTDTNDNYHGKLYLYNTETDEFTKIADKAVVATSVTGVIGSDDCVYYSTGTAVNKYNIKTKKTTVVIPPSYGFYPLSLTVSNDCNYIAFSSDNSNNSLWCDEGETAIFRYNISEDKIEHRVYKFDYSNWINHIQMNPADPDIVFFAHDGLIGEEEGKIPSYAYLYDREWTVNFDTGEIKNVFKQGRTEEDKSILFTSHEAWSTSGNYLYLNCYSNSSENGKGKCIIRCYPDGSHREYLKSESSDDEMAVDHAMATSDDKFTVVDSANYVYLLNNETYEQFPICYCRPSRYEDDNKTAKDHPYHPHPNVARNNYIALWGLEHEDVVGVAWYDFSELAKESASGGRYAVSNTIDRVSYEGLDCESKAVTHASKDCYHAGENKYLCFDINENVIDSANESITLSFDYYDNSTNDLVLTYTKGARSEAEDPYGNDLADSENASVTITRTATNTWKTYTTTIESGNFENVNPYRTDFKVGGGDVYLADIKVSNVADGYAGGDGSKENPYQISNAAELRYFSNQVRETNDKTAVDSNLSYSATKVSDSTATATYTPARYHVFTDKYFELTNDIDLCSEEFMPIGNLINNFNGHFDGKGHTISNVYINGTSPTAFERYAFFGSTGADVEIKNLGIENLVCKFKGSSNTFTTSINGEDYKYTVRLVGAAGFVSSYAGGTFTNCYMKNVEVRDMTRQMNSGGTGAFFGLGYGTVKGTEANGYNAMTVNNCYVNGAVLRSHSSASYGFIGPNIAPNSTSAITSGDYVVTKTLNNCYTANISRGYYDNSALGSSDGTTYDGPMYPFASVGDYIDFNNCHTASMGEQTQKITNADNTYTFNKIEVADRVLVSSDVATLKTFLVDNVSYYDDVKNVNGGYPILVDMSDKEIWDGVTDKKPEGEGTEKEPYLISTKEELVWAKNSVNTISDEGIENGYTSEADSHFKLMSDIDLEGVQWEPIGNDKVSFEGTFDGNGHIVKNFKITAKPANYEYAYASAGETSKKSYCTDKIYKYNGFFGKTGNISVVKNLGIEDAAIQFYNHDYYYQFATDESGVITEEGKASVRASYNGGMVGYAGGTFINCYFKNGKIKNMERAISDSGVGGFAGFASASSSFEGCYVKSVELCSSYSNHISGFASTLNSKNVEDCYVADTVEERKYATNAGRESSIYGFAYAQETDITLTNCFSTMSDYESATESGKYSAEHSVGVVSKSNDSVTKEEIINGVTGDGKLICDIAERNINDGYPICVWESVPFKDYKIFSSKDNASQQGFVVGGTIDKVTFYKNFDISDCDMYTVLYDKKSNNRMIACSIDHIHTNDFSEYANGTVHLSSPLAIPEGNSSDYVVKILFVSGEATFKPMCDNFEYSE